MYALISVGNQQKSTLIYGRFTVYILALSIPKNTIGATKVLHFLSASATHYTILLLS